MSGWEDNSKIIKKRQFGVQQHRNLFQIHKLLNICPLTYKVHSKVQIFHQKL